MGRGSFDADRRRSVSKNAGVAGLAALLLAWFAGFRGWRLEQFLHQWALEGNTDLTDQTDLHGFLAGVKGNGLFGCRRMHGFLAAGTVPTKSQIKAPP